MSEQRDAAAAALLEDLAPLGATRSKAMFGGVGVFADDLIFAFVDRVGTSFLRGAEGEVDDWVAAGAQRHGRMPYWSVPNDVRDDEEQMREWAQKAHKLAARAAK